MASQIITNIQFLAGIGQPQKPLRGNELAELRSQRDAYLIIEDGVISKYGEMKDLEYNVSSFSRSLDASGGAVIPTWADSHTHIVFAAPRHEEFVDKLKGLSYADIAAKGGGILNSARKLNESSEDALFNSAWERLQELIRLGTGAIEIKSGYGLSVEGELKMLRVIKKLQEKSSIPIRSTFLGAHTYPVEYRDNHKAYINMILDEMLPVIAAEKLADYIDVFCENGFFSIEETENIVRAAQAQGLKPKLHVNQLNSIGGIKLGHDLNALSVDHLEVMSDEDVAILSKSDTIGTLLPTAAFFLRMNYQPARRLIENNCAIALASDYNPGSSPSGNMNFVVSLACIQMKMLPEEAINAATINGAFAMELQNELGSIEVGKKANMIFMKPIPSISYIPYSFGNNLINKVMISGEIV